jgi:hypothetical protein
MILMKRAQILSKRAAHLLDMEQEKQKPADQSVRAFVS